MLDHSQLHIATLGGTEVHAGDVHTNGAVQGDPQVPGNDAPTRATTASAFGWY